jgi:hypothetical protein
VTLPSQKLLKPLKLRPAGRNFKGLSVLIKC